MSDQATHNLGLRPSSMISIRGRKVRLDTPTAISLVQDEILTCGMTYDRLAQAAGLCTGTISRIAIGHTTRPTFNTICAILVVLGWSLYAERGLQS